MYHLRDEMRGTEQEVSGHVLYRRWVSEVGWDELDEMRKPGREGTPDEGDCVLKCGGGGDDFWGTFAFAYYSIPYPYSYRLGMDMGRYLYYGKYNHIVRRCIRFS